jgi:cytochrome c-type biogenesis protein CcmF
MPWLVGTALIHSLAATEKRGVFRTWTVLLGIAAFSLSLIGTFLVRSGVLTSVHAFANDPTRGLFILALLTVITGGALILLVLRAHIIRSDSRFQPVSRESMLLVNNLLLVGACAVVFTGTLFPLLIDVLQMGKISVGPPYFNALFVPLTLALLVALGIGPLMRWKQHDGRQLARRLLPWALVSIALGFGLNALLASQFYFMVGLSLSLVFWVVITEFLDVSDKLANRHNRWTAFWYLPRHYKGMVVAHIGVVIAVTGVAITSAYNVERDVRLAVDETITVGPYDFRMLSLTDFNGPNYRATRAEVEVLDDDEPIALLKPEKRMYTVQQMPMTEVAIRPTLTEDLYLALGEPLDENSWAVRIHYKPFVRWIWLGALVMALGGFLAISDPRYRIARRTRHALIPEGSDVAQA